MRALPIVKATDLGSVQVLKHGNRFLLTDSFGDIHPDSRGLGLYQGDTRVLSCSVLRVGGVRPVLLQTSVGANFRGGIQMTNPIGRPQPAGQDPTGRAGRSHRRDQPRSADRRGGVSERLRIVNHGGRPARSRSTSSSASTAPTSSRSGGIRDRPAAGCCRPPRRPTGHVPVRRSRLGRAAHAPRLLGARRGRRARHRTAPGRVRQRRGGPPALDRDDGRRRDARAELDDLVDRAPGERPDPERRPLRRSSCAVPAGPAGLAGRGRRRIPRVGARDDVGDQRSRAVQPRDPALGRRDLRLLVNEGPGEDQRYVAAGVPWFSTLFGRDA